jgi:hypothetical protein
MTNSNPERRWYQFSMRTMLLVMLVFCVWIGIRVNWARNNRERVAAVVTAVTEIEKLGGEVTSAYQNLRPQTWLETLLDDPGSRDDPVSVLEVTSVSFEVTDQTDAGLEYLKDLPELEFLGLSYTRVTDAGLEHLKDLPKLRVLWISHTQVTDAGLEHLKNLTEIENLDLSFTQVTDAGLEHLKDLPKLTVLWLIGTQVTDEGVKKLQQALPNCKITR